MRFLLSTLFTFGLLAIGHSVSLPVFPEQYSVHGEILLPYAELKEPFSAYYDGVLNRSRIDYYGDLQITLQKSPAADKDSPTGSQYKIVWEPDTKGVPKRHCFKLDGDEDGAVTAQNVLPNLDGFTRIGKVRCPVSGLNVFKEGSIKEQVKVFNDLKKSAHPGSCELYRMKNSIGEKTNTYSFWFKFDAKSGDPIPVAYEMSGYNNLMGSHYDHYIVHYSNYREGMISEDLFNVEKHYGKCTGFPGPGIQKGGKKLLMNPMKAYLDTNRRLIDDHFEEFKKMHSKSYDTEFEHEQRRKLFLDNSRFIIAMNNRNPSYKLAVNHFADKSEDELQVLRGRKVTKVKDNGGLPYVLFKKDNDTLPAYKDWRLDGAINPVKDQAICGSCWSFGTVGTIEGVYFVKTGHLIRLSEQQLVDCSWLEGNNGCDGGEDFRSYQYLIKSGGIASDDDYGHYLGVDGKCHANDVKKAVKITGFVNVTQYSVEDLKKALVENGPITIAINAGVKTFTFYSHGVYDDRNCVGDENHLNHQVLLVGYGTLNNKDYWLVKNSWSTYWGNDGYVLIAQKDNICGVTTNPTYPLIDV